jgi:predicted secreted protein
MGRWSYDQGKEASVELTEADLPGEHTLGVGDEMVVRLPENRTTGYRWHLGVPEDGLEVADDSYEPPDPGRPGSGGTRTVRLRATRPGTHPVTAALRRSWEGAGAGKQVVFTVQAH